MVSIVTKSIRKFRNSSLEAAEDFVAVEEPLEIFINQESQPFLVTMRTPGDDYHLAVGLLFNMGILSLDEEITIIASNQRHIRIQFRVCGKALPASDYINSSCGLCNRPSWEDISEHSLFPVYENNFQISSTFLLQCKSMISKQDDDFHKTGGNHKVAIYSNSGSLFYEAEDVGRHNAFDKVIGQCYIAKALPLRHKVVLLSGRCSYEMCQKAWFAGIPIIISLGAPTSKAVELAEEAGISLVGFAKSNSFNIYTYPSRITHEEEVDDHPCRK